jgi:multidrug transporter EmrE-like cation transporter
MTHVTYLALAAAIVLEAGWALALKASHGLSKPGWAVATVVMYLASVAFLAIATRKMDIGVAYAIWAGAGIVLIALGGAVWFSESLSAAKIFWILVIVTGVIGLHVAGGHGGAKPPPQTSNNPVGTP